MWYANCIEYEIKICYEQLTTKWYTFFGTCDNTSLCDTPKEIIQYLQ